MDAYFDFTGLYDRNRDTLLPGAEYPFVPVILTETV